MALKRFSTPVDGTIPIQALLYDDEQLLGSQDNVGIYDGPQKSTLHQFGSVHITSHRLFYIDFADPEDHSFAIDLEYVNRTDFFGGLFTSSPKITLYLAGSVPSPPPSLNDREPAGNTSYGHDEADRMTLKPGSLGMSMGGWECEVCGNKNAPGLSPAAQRICGLCGVPRDVSSPNAPVADTPAHLSMTTSPQVLPGLQQQRSASTPIPADTDPPKASGSSRDPVPCPACTFLNHPSLRTCEICETLLPRNISPVKKISAPPGQSSSSSAATAASYSKSAPVSRSHTPSAGDDFTDDSVFVVKISFRKGGDKIIYGVLKGSLRAKAWEEVKGSDVRRGGDGEARGVGISGILRSVETTNQGREEGMQNALQDLEALMIKAKDMVKLAGELNEKLTAASASVASNPNVTISSTDGTTEPEEATFIRSSLTQLGLQMTNAPVTLDMMRDERKWVEELARELAGVLQGPGGLMASASESVSASRSSSFTSSSTFAAKPSGKRGRGRGIVALDEVWGGWNRARGVALIPPSTFLQVVPLLGTYTYPAIGERRFSSGLRVLCLLGDWGEEAFARRVVEVLRDGGDGDEVRGMAVGEITEALGGADGEIDGAGVSISLCKEMVAECERGGVVCRDDVGECAIVSGGGGAIEMGLGGGGLVGGVEVRWWINVFDGYVWDGENRT